MKKALLILLVFMIAACSMAQALAAPIHYSGQVAHPHIPSWENTQVPGYHQHRSDHTVMDWGDGEGKYDAYAVWTNETFNNIGDTTLASHGFIQQSKDPDYIFENLTVEGNVISDWSLGQGAKAQESIKKAFLSWSSITSDSPKLAMGLSFSNTSVLQDAEIRIRWSTPEMDPELKQAVAYFKPLRYWDFVLERYFNVMVFDRMIDWYFGDDRQAFLDSNKTADFLTIALHEIGHAVGLDHQSDKDDIMYSLAGIRTSINNGASFQALSTDDLNGARDLYSITTPEPSTVIISLLSLIPAALFKLRRRRGCR